MRLCHRAVCIGACCHVDSGATLCMWFAAVSRAALSHAALYQVPVWTACYKVACGFVARCSFVSCSCVDEALKWRNLQHRNNSIRSKTWYGPRLTAVGIRIASGRWFTNGNGRSISLFGLYYSIISDGFERLTRSCTYYCYDSCYSCWIRCIVLFVASRNFDRISAFDRRTDWQKHERTETWLLHTTSGSCRAVNCYWWVA